MSYQLTNAKVWDGAAWVEAVGGGLAYAEINATPTGSFTDGGISYEYYRFTSNSSLTVNTGGLIDVLVVGGGGGSASASFGDAGGGGAGGVRFGTFEVTASTFTVTVGAGGAAGSIGQGSIGSPGTASSFGSVLKAGGGSFSTGLNGTPTSPAAPNGGGGSSGGISIDDNASRNGGGAGGTTYGSNGYDGISLNYTGSTVEYGRGGTSGGTAVANTGSGGHYVTNSSTAAGANGVVIVRVRV